MRLKALFFPLMLLASISFFYGFVWPEIVKIQDTIKVNKDTKKIIEDIKNSRNNVQVLDQSLGENKEKQQFIESFFPKTGLEERVLDTISTMSSEAGVSLGGISIVSQSSQDPVQEVKEEDEIKSQQIFKSGVSSSETGEVVQTQPVVTPKSIEYSIGIVGKYENVKNFLDMLNKLEMVNSVPSVQLSVASANKTDEKAASAADLVSAGILVSFQYMKNVKWSGDYNNPLFQKEKLDFSGYEKVKNYVSKKVPVLTVSEKGRANPFQQ